MSNNERKTIREYVGEKVEEVLSSPMTIFPSDLYLLSNGDDVHGTYSIDCYNLGKVCGLVVFSYQSAVQSFINRIGETGGIDQIEEATFEEAREIAKMKDDTIVCLLLCDDLEDVKIHYIR